MPEDIAHIVANHPLLAGLPGDAVGRVADCATNVAVPAGHLLLAEGGGADTLYLLRRGRVTIEVHVPGRGALVIETLGPGAVIGWSWLFPPYRWQFDARASQPIGVIAVDAVCLRTKAEADSQFGYELMKRFASTMVERLQATQLRLVDLYGTSPQPGELDEATGPR